VTFELMVLFASIATVLGCWPSSTVCRNMAVPFCDPGHMKELTCNRYGIVVDARDKEFQPESTRSLLRTTGAIRVELLKRETPSRFYRERIVSVPSCFFSLGWPSFPSTATRMVYRYGGEIPPVRFHEAPAESVCPTGVSEFKDGLGTRTAVEGTVARGSLPYAFVREPGQKPGRISSNPVSGIGPTSMARGRVRYGVFCQPCHGVLADGRGTLTAGVFPRRPPCTAGKRGNGPTQNLRGVNRGAEHHAGLRLPDLEERPLADHSLPEGLAEITKRPGA